MRTARALHPNIIHSDSRTEAQVEEIAARDFSGGLLSSDRQPAGHPLYAAEDPLVQGKSARGLRADARWFLNIKDYIYGNLTGRFGFTDYSDASLTIALDINNRRWATELLRRAEAGRGAHAQACWSATTCAASITRDGLSSRRG